MPGSIFLVRFGLASAFIRGGFIPTPRSWFSLSIEKIVSLLSELKSSVSQLDCNDVKTYFSRFSSYVFIPSRWNNYLIFDFSSFSRVTEFTFFICIVSYFFYCYSSTLIPHHGCVSIGLKKRENRGSQIVSLRPRPSLVMRQFSYVDLNSKLRKFSLYPRVIRIFPFAVLVLFFKDVRSALPSRWLT